MLATVQSHILQTAGSVRMSVAAKTLKAEPGEGSSSGSDRPWKKVGGV